MALSDDDVREILRIIDESQLDELRIDMPGFRLHVRRGGAPPPPAEAPPPPPPPPERRSEPAPAAPAGSPPEPAAPVTASANGAATIDAPMLGTFYRASAPGEQPFVEVGSKVDADTVVCLIEVMKMMNSVKAGVAGTVVEVCAANAELVEYGEPLFRVDPDA
ncbi:MAG: acetyl-CoA carboxylase biotin carboxyl carrier protein [Solirubrobacteraceae bacterium]|jgi:acetyl-CoA carboxylase biotin carboxyl carrier protein|nr:acetyl-CoA carboxylase biotin carboxyl carrier protein [Solirubrobacteraceae bacterium]